MPQPCRFDFMALHLVVHYLAPIFFKLEICPFEPAPKPCTSYHKSTPEGDTGPTFTCPMHWGLGTEGRCSDEP
jgi:hypothetical protein